jgi:hypothetical protein
LGVQTSFRMFSDPNGFYPLIEEYLFYEPFLIPAIMVGVLAIGAQWSLYLKCDLNGVACVVPVWNVLEFLKIMGRPAWHSLIVMIPPLVLVYALLSVPLGMSPIYLVAGALMVVWTLFMMKAYVELCQSFGKLRPLDYFLCIFLNGFYVLYLGISSETEWYGPVYGKKLSEIKAHINEVEAED